MITKKEFIERVKPLAIKAHKDYNILPSLTISQAICESAWGKKAPGNMLFGIKWTYGCGYDFQELWTSEFVNGKYIKVKAKFRKYDNWDESIEDHSKLLMLKRYTPVRECKDYICATEQIKVCGYATSPSYTQTLRKIIEQNKLQVIDYEVQKFPIYSKEEIEIEQFIKLLENTKEVLERLLERIKKILSEPIRKI